jgi:hypothetical protein
LVKGNCTISAPDGNIYVQDINNPNGVFNDALTDPAGNPNLGRHYFDYDPDASVTLDAADNVEFTGKDAPQKPTHVEEAGGAIPMILPPSLTVIAGGDLTLDTSVILFPSTDQNLNLNIDGNFIGVPTGGNAINLEMSDSAAASWTDLSSFGVNDHASQPPGINNPNLVGITVDGNVQDINLYTTLETQMTVHGNMIDSGFVGENLHATDTTSITVDGNIEYSPEYSFADLISAIISANPAQAGVWDSVFDFAINPADVASDSYTPAIKAIQDLTQQDIGSANSLASYLNANGYMLFPSPNAANNSTSFGQNPGFIYDSGSLELGFKGSVNALLNSAQIAALTTGNSITVLVANSKGIPQFDPITGKLETITYTFNWGSAVSQLATESVDNTTTPGIGFQIGGPGQFNIKANAINLGNSAGIVSYGFGSGYGPDFASLENVCGVLDEGGAGVTVEVTGGDLDMQTSQICSIDGGTVKVTADQGNINLSQGNFVFAGVDTPYGIWTSGHSDVKVEANGNVNVGSARIATFNGGKIEVTSDTGDVNCGNGANIALAVYGIYISAATGLPITGQTFGNLTDIKALEADPAPYGSGILAEYVTPKYQTPGGNGQPGDITISTPNGNIVSAIGGIIQLALDGNIAGGPIVTLTAGTPGTPATPEQGNVLLGNGGVIGGTVNITAQGDIEGLIVSRQNANINTPKNVSVTVLSGGSANVSAGGSVSGTLVGISGVAASGSDVTATMLSQNVSANGGASQSTLGSSASATSTSQAAAQQSSQAAQQVATTDTSSDDDDQKKKKKQSPTLHTKRVTVLLSDALPPH